MAPGILNGKEGRSDKKDVASESPGVSHRRVAQ